MIGRLLPTDQGQYNLATGKVVVAQEDLGQSLLDARDPDADYQGGPRRYPYLAALGLHAGLSPH